MATPVSENEVKGIWFVTARRYLTECYPEGTLGAVLGAMNGEASAILEDPIASSWYPEGALQETLRALRRVVAGDDRERFLQALETCTTFGIDRFISSMLGLANPAFVLRRVPVLWKHMRRGPGTVTVDSEENQIVVRYRDFPYFWDENYELLTIGALRGLLAPCGGAADTRVLSRSRTHLFVAVSLGAGKRKPSRHPPR